MGSSQQVGVLGLFIKGKSNTDSSTNSSEEENSLTILGTDGGDGGNSATAGNKVVRINLALFFSASCQQKQYRND